MDNRDKMEMRVKELERARFGTFLAMAYDYANVEGDRETLKEYVKRWNKDKRRAAFDAMGNLSKCSALIFEAVKEVENEEREKMLSEILGDDE